MNIAAGLFRRTGALVGLILWQISAATAGYSAGKIDEPLARHLASEAYSGDSSIEPYLEREPKISLPFITFNGLTVPPAEGSFGYFAVNPWTGDVWALWGCHRLSTPALRRSQAEIRRRFSRSEMRRYARLRRLKPKCGAEY
ncbi:MAG: hypothetical protein JO038_06025 [Alphaproteobacteria bacterium]|nr:hypothetical protein [Alphaproteobacteria bacterium]